MIHRKHKLFTATLTALSLATLTACGADADPKAVETVTTTVEAEPTPEAAPAEENTEGAGADPAATLETEEESTPAETTEPVAEEPASEPPKQEPQNLMGDGKAEFIHFTVESLPPPNEPPADEDRTWAYGRTCLNNTPWEFIDTGKTPISADAYGIELAPSGKKLKRVPADGLEPAYPEEGELAPHDCAEGFIAFEPIEEEIDALTVTYDNSLGESASWNYH